MNKTVYQQSSKGRQGGLLIDTLAMSQRLRAVGVPEAQANEQIEIIAGIFEQNMAMKADIVVVEKSIEELRGDLKRDIEALRAELKQDIQEIRSELKQDIQKIRSELKQDIHKLRVEMYRMKSEIIIWVAGLLLAQAALITTIQKLF